MIKEIIINEFKRIRVWVGELPFECFDVKTIDKKYESYNKYAVELKNGITCNNNYALLGGEFKKDALHKNINVTTKNSPFFQNKYYSDYSAHNDTPIIGINSEIIEWINEFETCTSCHGEIIINCAAFAPIGSSKNCFKSAYELLISLIECQNNKSDFDVFIKRCHDILIH